LYPSIACYRIASSDDLRRIVNYIFKPIDLAGAYGNAAERVNYMPAEMEHLNGETNEFLMNVLTVFWNLRRLTRYGRCNASHHGYFGHVTEYRRAQRECNAEQRASAGADRTSGKKSTANDIVRWERHYWDELDRPAWPRRSRFQYWKAVNEPTPPPSPGDRGLPYVAKMPINEITLN
jgi:hypothetical protein